MNFVLRDELRKLRYLRHGLQNYYCGEDMPYVRYWLERRRWTYVDSLHFILRNARYVIWSDAHKQLERKP